MTLPGQVTMAMSQTEPGTSRQPDQATLSQDTGTSRQPDQATLSQDTGIFRDRVDINIPQGVTMISPQTVTQRRVTEVVLSLFPGIDLLGKGFEQAGYCVVRGPDLIFGGDIRAFHVPPGLVTGIIGGPPCQDFSKKKRSPPTGYGKEMLAEFKRVILEAQPQWWLLENVPSVPDVKIPGYSWQRIDLRANEFGLTQRRLRHFQFGSSTGSELVITRAVTVEATEPCCLATEGTKSNRRNFGKFCTLQGLPHDFDLPAFTTKAKYRAVGNGVPIPMAIAIATAIRYPAANDVIPCQCSCGRPVTGKAIYATAACRKRAQRRRNRKKKE